MNTKAAAFVAKIRNLNDYHLRLQHGVLPTPSGVDIANAINYFSQTLTNVLKDVPNSPLELLKCADKDGVRMALYPSLDYRGLYMALQQLVDVAPLMQFGLHAFGQSLLQCLGCILPFLEHDMIDTLPYLTASSMSALPASLHQDIVNSLCYYILPFTITRNADDDQTNYASQSVSAVVMMVFQYSDDMAHHCQMLECLMTLKLNLVKDLLCVIAYGTSGARMSAAKLLFYYWPTFNSRLFERRGTPPTLYNRKPFPCQRDMCPNAGTAEAAKVCYDHCISITFATKSPPPLYLCIECANEIHREHPEQMFYDILHPMLQGSVSCENKNCRSSDKSVVSICFTTECVSYNSNHPIRYCQQCHSIRHNNRRGGDHIVHTCLPKAWDMDSEMLSYLVEAIVSLLKEARTTTAEIPKDMNDIQTKAALLNVLSPSYPLSTEERQLMGRFGVWLLVGLCTPKENTSSDILGRLLSMLFHWFHVTAYSFDDQAECTLEQLKTDYVCQWLNEVCQSHFNIFVSCLLPHPPDYARVGGHWDMLVSRTSHLKNGLNRLFSLVPYEVITPEIWDFVMPHWLEAIVKDVPEKELPELKLLLSKMLDPEMSPLGFEAKKLFHFVSVRFKQTTPKVMEQALNWLQILTILDIVIHRHLLFTFFEDGINSMKEGETLGKDRDSLRKSNISPVVEDESGQTSGISDDEGQTNRQSKRQHSDGELKLSCCVLMLDIVLKQMEKQGVERHTGIHTVVAQDTCRILQWMLQAPWLTSHVCTGSGKTECVHCELTIVWHQLALELVGYIAQENPAHPPDPPLKEESDEHKSPGEDKKAEPKPDVVINMPLLEIHTAQTTPKDNEVPYRFNKIMTATVETVMEQLDLAPMIISERAVPAVARAVTLTDTDVATAKVNIARPNLVGENDQPVEHSEDDMDDFWHTSVGKFRFSIDELPHQLQYIHTLLKELPKTEEPDVLYYMLQCLHLMVLHGDALNKAVKDHRGFIIWCQENLIIKNLWDICNAEHSHICETCVPILLHCITLPSGSDVFWRVIQDEFHSSDWRVRFVAVERVTVIARFMDSTPLRAVMPLQAALANAFCYLISSMDDPNVQVAQRATLYLGTVHDTAMQSLIMCLETQFDSVIVDRPMVLQSIYQLHNSLSDRKILSWEFFLNRFDALFLEAQLNLEKTSGDVSYFRDLRNTDMKSEVFIRKLHRAQEALTQSDTGSSKTLSASFGPKWPYKRTMSAPASMVPRQDTKEEKEKVYSRQSSAPILKRKSSRFGLDGHIHSMSAAPVPDETNLVGFMHRVIDLEESDRETMHLLVFLLMQFLSRSDQAFPSDEKSQAKTQTIVLRHLYLLLGYNQNERGFHIPSHRLRQSPVFNVFIANLPQLLDQNHLMGWMVIPTCLVLLQYCPCPPHHHPPESPPHPPYSLWYLEPHTRRSWLMSLLVLLYKYQYNQQPLCSQLQALVKIVINTLDSQHHVCRRIPPTVVMGAPPSRSRDVSQPSLGVEGEHGGMDTPPLSPMYSGADVTGHVTSRGKTSAVYHQKSPSSMETHWEEDVHSLKGKRHLEAGYSTEAEETESELAAIPESKSDSTAHGSSQGSFEEDRTDDPDGKKKGNDGSSRGTRPVWFLGSDDHSIQKSNGSGLAGLAGKWGVKEGMKMLVTSSLFSVTPPSKIVPPTSPAEMSSKTPSASTPSIPTVREGPTPVSPHHPPPPLTLKPTLEKDRSLEKDTECWPDNSQHGSPVPRPMGRGKRAPEGGNTPTSTSSSTPTPTPTSHPPWQIDGPGAHYKAHSTLPCQERLLHTGNSGKPVCKAMISRRQEETTNYGSPDSPLSKMDVISVESPQESQTDSVQSVSHLEMPPQERLLPIGSSVPALVQHVRQALGVNSCDLERKASMDQGPTRSPSDIDSLSYTKQDSFERSEPLQTSRSISPRRLIKQVALESPPPTNQPDHDAGFFRKPSSGKADDKDRMQKSKVRRQVPFAASAGAYNVSDSSRRPTSWCGAQQQSLLNPATQQACHAAFELKQSSFRVGEDCVYERCGECGTVREEYSDEELGLCIVILGTFIHREPALAAPLLPDILTIVAKLAMSATYPWQCESNMYLPGGAISVAHQFIRCVLHQLAPNGVFVQMFQTHVSDSSRMQFFRSVAQALLDFNELNPIAPLQLLLENLNSKKSLCPEQLPVILHNTACYLDCLPLEAGLGPGASTWSALLAQLELLFRRIVFVMYSLSDVTALLRIMVSVLRVPGVQSTKGILDPFSKILAYGIQNCSIKYHYLIDLCYLCNRAFTREREKQVLTRVVVFELVQAIKFKTAIPDSNFLMLINFILQDSGGILPPSVAMEGNMPTPYMDGPVINTGAADCMRQHLNDALDFLSDFHTLGKIKSFCKGMPVGLNEDTLGGTLKSGIAQFVALEMMRGNNRDNRAAARCLPWLYGTTSLQQGPREFLDCVGHIRLLSWLLLGSLTHTALHANVCTPVPQEASCQIADHVQIIMAGFAEQPKASVPHMSSLFHAFVLCQLWTVYLEQNAAGNLPSTEAHSTMVGILFDFWGKVTPCVLQMVSHSKVLAEMVNLHFLSLLEGLLECNSAILSKLLPIWSPVLFAHYIQLPGHLQLRLQGCRNLPPVTQLGQPQAERIHNPQLLRWLQRLQFKMGQIELQSSAATHFYSI
ncbi:protein unc-79 homolog isoform X2 [Macrosteles quadrilineatus]|uniref:protein unc-79 homolog isoform X2 n=1 Tax=Macrosteles quadrilineatus TaxID=74068 RepID=UPI0023E1E574|nr:protein unc-79 homolog isoform X2 [Macrosteles quadrilineatus]